MSETSSTVLAPATRLTTEMRRKRRVFKREDVSIALMDQADMELDDPELMTLRRQMAVLQAMWKQKVNESEFCGGMRQWERVESSWQNLQSAMDEADASKVMRAMASLRREVEAGCTGALLEKDIRDIFQEQKAISQAEIARMKQMGAFLTMAQIAGILAQVSAIINTQVLDVELRKRIQTELSRISVGKSGESDRRAPGTDDGEYTV